MRYSVPIYMRTYKFLLACSLLLISFYSRAELTIEITQGVDQPVPIAVVPFEWKGVNALSTDVAAVVESDLLRSGLFKPMPRAQMLSFPSRQQDVYYRDWRLSGQEYLVIGRVIPDGTNRLKVDFFLYDVVKEQILESGYEVDVTQNLRRIAHRISDRIYQKLTGIRGAFNTEIVYVTARQLSADITDYRLYRSDSDGFNAQEMLRSNAPILSPAWADDGVRIAYVSFETGRPAVYIQNKLTGQREQITAFRGLNGAPTWSPDGRKLALTLSKDGNPEIYIIDIRTRQLKRLTRHYGIDTEPNWSPDGRSIIFTSDRGGKPQIYRVELATGFVERLTFEGDYNARGRLSQDGRHLVMVHRDQGVFHIAVQDLKTGRFDVVSETYLDESPSIAPNGTMVIYATQEGNKGVLSAVSVDGRVKFKLPAKAADVREPAWSPYLQ